MKYGLILRKLVIDDVVYYQVVDKFEGRILENDQIYVEDAINYKGEKLNSFDKSYSKLSYLELDKEQYSKYDFDIMTFFKLENNVLSNVTKIVELNEVAKKFYDSYKDFMLIPSYNINEIISDIKSKLQDRLLGQDDAINKVLNKIYSNCIYFDADIELAQKYKNKNNILVISPKGTGKTTMKEVIMDNLTPIPTIEMSLTGDINADIINMFDKILHASNGNLFMAMNSIVIFDGIESLLNIDNIDDEENFVKKYINELKKIMTGKLWSIKLSDDQICKFDTSLLTYICLIDMRYYDKIEDNMIYSNISSDELEFLGIAPMVDNYFNSEIIFMNNMTKDLAYKILKDKNLSPLLELKRVCENKGYKVHFERQFVEKLIENGLDKGDGMTGILQLLRIVLQSKDFTKNNLIFKASDFDKLKIGTCIYDDSEEYDENYEKSIVNEKKSEKSKKDPLSLKVNLNMRTINGLTVMDTVNKIKENVKGQDEQIFTLVNAFYNHIFNKNKNISYHERKELKENVLLIGGTGVGKTSMLENLAKIFDIPYQRELATRYSASGYVGEDVDTMLVDLIKTANGDVNKAENGILYIDEIDKINVMPGDSIKMGGAVQNQLLTIIEGSKRSINAKEQTYDFDTTDLFVSATGVFEDLDKIVKYRIKKESGSTVIGFSSEPEKMIDKDIKPEDIVKCGFDRQFVGRFPIIIKLNDLDENIFLDIINNSKNGYVNLCKKSYNQSNITIEMSDDFKKRLAKRAMEQKNGARGIKTVFSKIRNEIDRNIQNGDIKKVILNENCIEDPKQITYVKRK